MKIDRVAIYKYAGINGVTEYISQRRQTGKSLGQAFYLIGCAMKDPEVQIAIEDFEPYAKLNDRSSFRIISNHIEDIVRKYELQNLNIDYNNKTLTYKLPWSK